MAQSRLLYALAAGLVFVTGCVVSMHFGALGLHPLDSPIVFDGAWRLTQGQKFFQDFDSPNGFVPISLQCLFFKVFGVNWWAYRLQAGLMNGLFALLTADLLRRVGLNRWVALAYGLLGTIVFYPPMGVPYMDQHAFFFVLAAIWAGTAVVGPDTRRRGLWLALAVVASLASILSKQSPGFLAPPLVTMVLLMGWRQLNWRTLGWGLLGGLVGSFVLFWAIVGWPGSVGTRFGTYFWEYPRALGNSRLAAWDYGPLKTVRTLLWLPFQTLGRWNLLHRHFLYLPILLAGGEWLIRKLPFFKRASVHDSTDQRLDLRPALLGIALTLVSSMFIHLTLNQHENGIALVYVSLGLGMATWRSWWQSRTWRPAVAGRWLGVAGTCALLLYGAACAYGFGRDVLTTRRVLDMEQASAAPGGGGWDEGIAGLSYQVPYHWAGHSPGALLRWLGQNDGNFLLMGDMSLLYGLSGRPSVTPWLWWHEGLTLPHVGSPAWAQADADLLARMLALDVHMLVFEQPGHVTYMGSQFECFARTSDWVYARCAAVTHVGGYEIWLLR